MSRPASTHLPPYVATRGPRSGVNAAPSVVGILGVALALCGAILAGSNTAIYDTDGAQIDGDVTLVMLGASTAGLGGLAVLGAIIWTVVARRRR